MFEKLKKYYEENWETIYAAFISMNGGYYRPYGK